MLLLATDLDGTFLGGSNAHKQQLYALLRNRENSYLVFVTGRGLETVIPLLSDPLFPHPDFIIGDVGATVVDGRTFKAVEPIQSSIEEKWPGTSTAQKELERVKNLRLQNVPQSRRCSFFYDERIDMEHLMEVVASLNCDLLISAGKFIDVLPGGVNKGSTLKQLIGVLQLSEEDILVAGDTMNDLSLYETGYKGVVVGAAEEKLVQKVSDMKSVYVAQNAGAGGILEAFDHFPGFSSFNVTG